MFPRSLCLAALLLAAPAFAGTAIDQTRPLAADGTVAIDNLKGRIVVRSWDRAEVRITGTLGEGVEKLDVRGDATDLSIEVRYPENRGGWFNWGGGNGGEPSTIEVTLPKGASVAVDSVSAEIDIAGVGGRRLSVDSVSGGVQVRDSRAEEADFDNVSGDLDLELDSADGVRVDTVSGDTRLRGRIGGRVSIDTVSGDATLEAGTLERLSLDTVSGDGRMRVGLAPAGSIKADSVSGSLTLSLPKDTSARLRLETFSGSITSPVGQVQTEEFGPGKHLDARMGDGSADIQLESFSGRIRVELQ